MLSRACRALSRRAAASASLPRGCASLDDGAPAAGGSGPSPPGGPSEHKYLRLRNAPILALASEVVRALRGAGLPVSPEDLVATHSPTLTQTGWLLRLPRGADGGALTRVGVGVPLGVRSVWADASLPATADEWARAHAEPAAAKGSRGAAVVVSGLPPAVSTSDVEALFVGYSLHPDAVTLLRFNAERRGAGGGGERGGGGGDGGAGGGEAAPAPGVVVRAAVVKFAGPLDAHRAVRERHRDPVGSRVISVRLLQ